MTALLAAATAATALDAIAYLGIVVPGYASEQNPVVASLTIPAALWARAAVVVLMFALTLLASLRPTRHLRLTVGAALWVAILVGLAGASSTVWAARS